MADDGKFPELCPDDHPIQSRRSGPDRQALRMLGRLDRGCSEALSPRSGSPRASWRSCRGIVKNPPLALFPEPNQRHHRFRSITNRKEVIQCPVILAPRQLASVVGADNGAASWVRADDMIARSGLRLGPVTERRSSGRLSYFQAWYSQSGVGSRSRQNPGSPG